MRVFEWGDLHQIDSKEVMAAIETVGGESKQHPNANLDEADIPLLEKHFGIDGKTVTPSPTPPNEKATAPPQKNAPPATKAVDKSDFITHDIVLKQQMNLGKHKLPKGAKIAEITMRADVDIYFLGDALHFNKAGIAPE
ncbi:hypothetical protein Pla110_44350 [Polystyrenella longa]|uniref:Uncharacterized protein n=1 Tax=Polystyrenella longa TaxID=2528007 RepID=A0A518CU10_9PLAN|nr:hypothetical protein [Polystyrenella longa]QDU82674.1 hypothetical protein Pla110_44350 [Polystyrenella longa]